MGNDHDLLRALIRCATVFEIADGVTIEACRQRDKTVTWAVRSQGNVLNKHQQWEYEPLPSSRSEAFLQRTRFATIGEAVEAIERRGDITLTCAPARPRIR